MNDLLEPQNYEQNQPSTRQWILIAVIGFMALLGIIIFLAGGYFTASSFLQTRSLQATETVAAATVVIQERLSIVESAAQWPLEMFEPFDDNENEWIDGTIDDEYATMELTIDGDYTWEISSKQGFVWWVYPTSDMVSNFYLAVDAINQSSNQDAPHGLIFGLNEENQAYHYFEIRDSQLFSVWSNNQGVWTEIVSYTTAIAIRPGEVNHLEVVSQADSFYFLINDELVAETSILSPTQGYAGVAVGLSYEDEQSTISFDNFELRVP